MNSHNMHLVFKLNNYALPLKCEKTVDVRLCHRDLTVFPKPTSNPSANIRCLDYHMYNVM